MRNQHRSKLWLGVVGKQAISWANIDANLCRHMASLGCTEFCVTKLRIVGNLCNELSFFLDYSIKHFHIGELNPKYNKQHNSGDWKLYLLQHLYIMISCHTIEQLHSLVDWSIMLFELLCYYAWGFLIFNLLALKGFNCLMGLTHWDRVTHNCVGEMGYYWFR